MQLKWNVHSFINLLKPLHEHYITLYMYMYNRTIDVKEMTWTTADDENGGT